jgi:hypothetical protein
MVLGIKLGQIRAFTSYIPHMINSEGTGINCNVEGGLNVTYMYKIIRQVKETEESEYKRRTYFCSWSLWAVYDTVLDPKLSFLMKSDCI